MGFIFGEIGGEPGWVEPDTPTRTHLALVIHTPTLHSTVDCECCSDEDIQGRNLGIKCLPIQLCYTLGAVQRGRDILFLCTRWSASAATISHTRPSTCTALVLSSSSWSAVALSTYHEACYEEEDAAPGGPKKKGHTDTVPWCLLF